MSLLELPRFAVKLGVRVIRLPLTTYEVFSGKVQPEDSDARVAQQGFVEGAVGKVQQVAGIVLGDDDLLARGRLRQAKASEIEEAATNEAVAKEKQKRAEEQRRKGKAEVTSEKIEAASVEVQRKAELERERQERKATTDAVAKQRADLEKKAAQAKKDQAKREAEKKKADAAKKQRAAAARKVVSSVGAAAREEAADEAERNAEALARTRTRT